MPEKRPYYSGNHPLASTCCPCRPRPAPHHPWAVAVPLPLRPSDSGRADKISLMSPSPQVQRKSGLWERKFQIPFSASACPQLSVPIVVILANEKKKETRGAARDASVIASTWFCFARSWRSSWPSPCL